MSTFNNIGTGSGDFVFQDVPETNDLVAAFGYYESHGFEPLPINHKNPVIKDWPTEVPPAGSRWDRKVS